MIRSEIVHAIAVDAAGIGAVLLLAVTAIAMEDRFDGFKQHSKCVTDAQIYKPEIECRQVKVR